MSENLSFLSRKKQFKWSGDVDSLKAFWIDELEQGDPSLPTINSNGTCDVLKFESVTVNFYHRTKTVQVQGISKEEYIKKLTEIVSKNQGDQVINEDEEGQRESVTNTKAENAAVILNPSSSADEPMATVEDDGICSCTCKACPKIQSLDHRMLKLDENISNVKYIISKTQPNRDIEMELKAKERKINDLRFQLRAMEMEIKRTQKERDGLLTAIAALQTQLTAASISPVNASNDFTPRIYESSPSKSATDLPSTSLPTSKPSRNVSRIAKKNKRTKTPMKVV